MATKSNTSAIIVKCEIFHWQKQEQFDGWRIKDVGMMKNCVLSYNNADSR